LLSAVGAVYQNRIILNNINKLQNINDDRNGVITGTNTLAYHNNYKIMTEKSFITFCPGVSRHQEVYPEPAFRNFVRNFFKMAP
jgi:hypothetical protein